MKKGLILPLLVPLIAFAAVKGYAWYQVKSFVDQFAAQAAPFVTFDYESIDTSYKGVAGISNVRIYPNGSEYPINVSAIRIVSDDWVYLMKLGTPLDKGDLPNKLAFEMVGVDVDLHAPYIGLFSQQAAAAGNTFAGCERSQAVGIELLKQLGYSTLHTDIKLSYLFDPESEYITLKMDASGEDSFSMMVSGDVDLGVSALNREQMKGLKPKLGGVDFRYIDKSFNDKYIAHCAALYDEKASEFVARHVTLTAERYRRFGFEFNDELVEGYRSFISAQGDMSLSLNAANPVGMQELAMVGPEDYLKLMDVKLVVNGKKITPVNVGWKMPQMDMGLNQSASQDSGVALADVPALATPSLPEVMKQVSKRAVIELVEAEVIEAPVAPQPKVQVKKYLSTSVPELSKYVGSMIRVDTNNGHRIEGEIKRMLRNGVQIEQSMGNGTALLPIVYSNILDAKVLR